MKAEGPFMEDGDTQRMSVSANQRNVGLYTIYNGFTGSIDIVETKDITTYLKTCGYDKNRIDAVVKLKCGETYFHGEHVLTCLEEC